MTSLSVSTGRLADAIRGQAVQASQDTPAVRGADWRTAVVATVGSDGTVTTTDGIVARRLESYQAPAVADKIVVVVSGSGNWLAAGRTASAAGAIGVSAYTYKAAATDRTSTTTMTSDPDLALPLAGSAVYVVEFHLFVGGPSGGLMVTQWAVPSGASGLKGIHGPGSTATDSGADNISMRAGSHGFTTQVTYGRRNVNTNLLYAIETGTVITTSAGTCAVQWAQSASNSTATRMGLGSWMRATRIA